MWRVLAPRSLQHRCLCPFCLSLHPPSRGLGATPVRNEVADIDDSGTNTSTGYTSLHDSETDSMSSVSTPQKSRTQALTRLKLKVDSNKDSEYHEHADTDINTKVLATSPPPLSRTPHPSVSFPLSFLLFHPLSLVLSLSLLLPLFSPLLSVGTLLVLTVPI